MCFISIYPNYATPVLIPATSPIYTDQNAARSSYGLQSFIIDLDLIDIAQGITESCLYGDQSWKDAAELSLAQKLGVTKTSIGSNMAGSPVGRSMVTGWLNPLTKWNCLNNTCSPGGLCGLYTQIIWESTTRIGCAISTCSTGNPMSGGSSIWDFLVCLYNPAGNTIKNNVKQHPFGTDLSKCSRSIPQPSTQPPKPPVQSPTQPPVQPPTQSPVNPPSQQNSSAVPIPSNSLIYTQQNDARASYGISAFIIDQNLVDIAQSVTLQCKWGDKSWMASALTTYAQKLGLPSTSIGYNGGASPVNKTNINLWLAQKNKWNCETNNCTSGKCMGWTQIIWEKSVNIGCALSKCSTGSPLTGTQNWEYLLCIYNPSGGSQHPFGTDTSKCNSPALSINSSEDPQDGPALSIHADEVAQAQAQQHQQSSTQAEKSLLSVSAIVGITVCSVLGAAVIVLIVVIHFKSKT